MALIMDYQTDAGLNVSYWVITEINIDDVKKKARIQISGYINKDIYKSGKLPLVSHPLNAEDIIYPPEIHRPNIILFTPYFSSEALKKGNLYDNAYKFLLENIEMFKNAEVDK